MSSGFEPNENAGDEVDLQIGELLLQAGDVLALETKGHFSKRSFPPASKEGEYPHFRTQNLMTGIVMEPETPTEAAKLMVVRVGYTQRAWYGALLELFRDRLGLNATAEKLKGRISRILSYRFKGPNDG